MTGAEDNGHRSKRFQASHGVNENVIESVNAYSNGGGDVLSRPECIDIHQPDWMDVDDSANVDNEQPEGERTRTRDNNLMELFDDENNAIVLFLVSSEIYVWILESSNCESVDILLQGSLGDGDQEMYFKLGQSGVSVFGIMGEFVLDKVFNSALIWKRLIRSVCEQEFAKLKSSRLVLM